jgi:hypothetical protein
MSEQKISITIELTQADYDLLHNYTCPHKNDGKSYEEITPAQLVQANIADLVLEAKEFYDDIKKGDH